MNLQGFHGSVCRRYSVKIRRELAFSFKFNFIREGSQTLPVILLVEKDADFIITLRNNHIVPRDGGREVRKLGGRGCSQ